MTDYCKCETQKLELTSPIDSCWTCGYCGKIINEVKERKLRDCNCGHKNGYYPFDYAMQYCPLMCNDCHGVIDKNELIDEPEPSFIERICNLIKGLLK